MTTHSYNKSRDERLLKHFKLCLRVITKARDTPLTPLSLIARLGGFDLDPCAFTGHQTATTLLIYPHQNGLTSEWHGRVWLNPPYSNPEPFLRRMVAHNNGIALLLASVDAEWFHTYIWNKADSVFFPKGRPLFIGSSKTHFKLRYPSVLASYGKSNDRALQKLTMDGKYIPLR